MRASSETLADAVDAAAPLLNHPMADHLLRSRRFLRSTRPIPPISGAAARLLRRASARRMMLREPSRQVRESAAEQLESRQNDWAYSKPIVVLDVLWNLTLMGVAFGVLAVSVDEVSEVPLRVWVFGYACQCLFHIMCVYFEYSSRRREAGAAVEEGSERNSGGWGSGGADYNSSSGSDEVESVDSASEPTHDGDGTSSVKHLESANTMFSFVWWIIGFYWVTAGGPNLPRTAPQLYWLCITFLAFDVVFVVVCVAVACLIGLAVCCCLPCIIAILYAMSEEEGASQEDIDSLPKYKFQRYNADNEKITDDIQMSCGGVMMEHDSDPPVEHALSQEDAECCICLSAYEDGAQLSKLPCRHHFHSDCIDKWLKIKGICPLCKFNIRKSRNKSGDESV